MYMVVAMLFTPTTIYVAMMMITPHKLDLWLR